MLATEAMRLRLIIANVSLKSPFKYFPNLSREDLPRIFLQELSLRFALFNAVKFTEHQTGTFSDTTKELILLFRWSSSSRCYGEAISIVYASWSTDLLATSNPKNLLFRLAFIQVACDCFTDLPRSHPVSS